MTKRDKIIDEVLKIASRNGYTRTKKPAGILTFERCGFMSLWFYLKVLTIRELLEIENYMSNYNKHEEKEKIAFMRGAKIFFDALFID